MHIFNIRCQIVDTGEKVRQLGHFIAVDDLALMVGLTGDAEGVWINVLAPLPVLSFGIFNSFFLSQLLFHFSFLFFQFDHFRVSFLLVLLDREKIV